MKKIMTISMLSAATFFGCAPKATDIADETCKCFESILLNENFTKDEITKVKDSCIAIQREKYGNHIDEDRTLRKDLKAQEYKLEASLKKIKETYKNQINKVDAFEVISNYIDKKYIYSSEMQGLTIETKAWIMKKNGDKQLQLVIFENKDGNYNVMDIDDHKVDGWKNLNMMGMILANLNENQKTENIKEVIDSHYKQEVTIRGKIKSFESEPFSFFGYRVEKYYFILKDAEIISINDIK
jgi:hypothetical protein